MFADHIVEIVSYLKQIRISERIAETEHKIFFGVLWNSLNNAVFHPDGVLGNTVVVNPRSTIRFVKE